MDLSTLPEWAPPVACLLYMGLEYWIGKTPKLQSNSVLELVITGLKTVCGKAPSDKDQSSGK